MLFLSIGLIFCLNINKYYMETKETFNRIKNILILFIKVILLFFVLLILSFYILISFIFHYSNQYTTIENFKSNKESFFEIKDDIVLNKFLL
jgi:predicted membrane protein